MWQRFNAALAERRIPAREVFDGAMVIVGGTLLLTPGFITDIFGLILLIPPTRDVVRRIATAIAKRRGVGARRVLRASTQYDKRRPGAAGERVNGAPLRRRGHRPRGRRRAEPPASRAPTMSADALAIEIDSGARIEWAPDALRDLAAGPGGASPRGGSRATSTGTRSSRCGIVSAAFEDGRLLALVAGRPAGADGHDEPPRGLLVQPSGEVVELDEALLSTEYDSAGAPSRIGLELYAEPAGIPLRVAADRAAPARVDDGAEATPMTFRLEGLGGIGRVRADLARADRCR